MRTRVAEFNSKGEYEKWLEAQGAGVRIINVSTTKRWSFWTGFLSDAKTYTVTYETSQADEMRPDPL